MGLFKNLFRRKHLTITDSHFGEINSFSVRGDLVGWTFQMSFLGKTIDVYIDGTTEKISEKQKNILMDAQNHQPQIKLEAETALKEQLQNADIAFTSIEELFDFDSISLKDDGFELTFQEKADPYYFFHVYFINNKQVGVSVDG